MPSLKFEIVFQTTFASQSSNFVANVKVRRNRQMRRKRQSASQSRFASQTSKCVAVYNLYANNLTLQEQYLTRRAAVAVWGENTKSMTEPIHSRSFYMCHLSLKKPKNKEGKFCSVYITLHSCRLGYDCQQ
jgi:hypothetical protein